MLIYPLLEKIDAYVLSDGELCLSFGRLGGWLIASVCNLPVNGIQLRTKAPRKLISLRWG